MTDEPHEPVGSLAEELSKLMGVVAGVAETRGKDGAPSADDRPAGGPQGGDAHPHGPHIADGSASCQVCPVCQTIAFVRQTSPEVREQLTASAAALTAAARGLVDAFAAHQGTPDAGERKDDGGSGVESIDLSEDESWD